MSVNPVNHRDKADKGDKEHKDFKEFKYFKIPKIPENYCFLKDRIFPAIKIRSLHNYYITEDKSFNKLLTVNWSI
ncbi:MAG TPA: hypothetical protein DCS91_19315 [Microcoleaceae bacterium UBA11344]|nr:hypothetical protein [Microcoleaceae cyanobacterium UBA11344]